MLQALQQAAEQNFIRVQHTAIWRVAQTPEEAIRLALETPLWDTSIRRFAAI